MTTFRMRGFTGVLLILLSGCARSPEARSDKYLAEGRELLNKKDYSRALLAFRNAAQAKPDAVEPIYEIGVASLASGDIRIAVASFRKALELNPSHEGAQLKLAQIMASSSEEVWVKEAEKRLKELMGGAAVTPEMLTALAVTELKLGKTESAIKTLENVLSAAPQQLFSSIMLARAKLAQKDVKGAEAVLLKACTDSPDLAEARIVLGEFYASQNRMTEAEHQFQHALQINPKSGEALSDLARLQYHVGRKNDAEQTFQQMTSLPSRLHSSLYALFLYQEGRKDEAVKEFERLFQQDPQDRLARTRLIAAYQAANREEDASKLLEQVLKSNNNDLEALLQRAELSRVARKYTEAEADLNQVLRLKPDSGEVHYVMAKLHRARGANLSYRQQLSEALKLNPYLLSARLELVQELLLSKQIRAASDILNATPESQKQLTPVRVQRNWAMWAAGDMAEMRKGIDLGLSRERSTELLIQDGLWKLRVGNAATARTALEEALKIDPSDIRALRALSITYVSEKQNALAVQKVKEYASLQPKSAPVQEFLGMLLMASGDRSQARSAFEAAKTADSKFVRADLSLIQTDLLDGKVDDAHRRLQGVVSGDGSNILARLWMGNLEAMKGNHKVALEEFRHVVAADSNNAQGLNNFAYMLAEFGNQPAEALKYAQKAKELAPDSPEYSDTLGWILYRQGLYSLAVKELERAAANPGNPVWKYHLAMAYAKVGDAKRGRATLEAALARDPNVPEAKVAREMLGIAK